MLTRRQLWPSGRRVPAWSRRLPACPEGWGELVLSTHGQSRLEGPTLDRERATGTIRCGGRKDASTSREYLFSLVVSDHDRARADAIAAAVAGWLNEDASVEREVRRADTNGALAFAFYVGVGGGWPVLGSAKSVTLRVGQANGGPCRVEWASWLLDMPQLTLELPAGHTEGSPEDDAAPAGPLGSNDCSLVPLTAHLTGPPWALPRTRIPAGDRIARSGDPGGRGAAPPASPPPAICPGVASRLTPAALCAEAPGLLV